MLYERLLDILKELNFNPILNEDDEYMRQSTISISICANNSGFSDIVKYHFSKDNGHYCIGCEVL